VPDRPVRPPSLSSHPSHSAIRISQSAFPLENSLFRGSLLHHPPGKMNDLAVLSNAIPEDETHLPEPRDAWIFPTSFAQRRLWFINRAGPVIPSTTSQTHSTCAAASTTPYSTAPSPTSSRTTKSSAPTFARSRASRCNSSPPSRISASAPSISAPSRLGPRSRGQPHHPRAIGHPFRSPQRPPPPRRPP